LGNPKLGRAYLLESHSFLAKISPEEVLKSIFVTETIQPYQVFDWNDFIGKSNDKNQMISMPLTNGFTGDHKHEEEKINFKKVVQSIFISNYNNNIIKRRIQK